MATNLGGFRKIMRIGGMKIPSAGLLLSILFFAGGCGCGKNEPPKPAVPEENLPEVVTNLTTEPAYLQELAEIRKKQSQQAQARGKVLTQMDQKVAAVKARLLKALDAEIKAELEKDPEALDAEIKAELEKDPEWKSLEEEDRRMIKQIKDDLVEARVAVRARLAKECEARKAVAEGRAKVAGEKERGK